MSDTRERCVHGWVDPMEWCTSCMAARIAELEAQLGITRMCVNCGKCKPASEPQHEPLPECVGEDGLSACTFDTTPQEAWEHWRMRARELEAENERLVAGLESVIRSMPPDEHGYLLPGRVQAELVLGGSKRPLERLRNQIAELEAQVRERDAALRAAQDFARFGSWAFEQFWSDGEPGDIDASDAQEKAIECGLLGRTSEVDPNTTHAEGCDYSPGADALKCCCFAPTRRPLIGGAK